MQNWDSMPQANYDHNWYGGVFPTIKREPASQSFNLDHHMNHQKSNSMDIYNSSTSPPRAEGLEGHSFYENHIYNGLNNSHHPLGFNPLTPPGYPNAVMPQMNFGPDSSQDPISSTTTNHQKQTEITQSLTPSHTPPMDVTPPKSPKSIVGTPEKDIELSSNSNDSGEDTRFLESDNDDESINKPKFNSHGKVKKFKCKQCEYVAITKVSFWTHARDHIKPEKLLECHFCPFVTELKHHLEYHIRKHKNLKPFQCDKCSYSCVNKSMLNSHLKSHSTVYQYRCANCDYATKYCHSFKLHLRKYTHKPGMVLNEDGTPNPSVIIDVYGTRRGPKMKSGNSRDVSSSKATKHDSRNSSQPLQSTPTQTRVSPLLNSQSSNMMSKLLPNTLANMLQQSGNLPFFPYLNLNLQMLAAQQQAVLAQLSPNLGAEQPWDNENQTDDTTSKYDSETDDFDQNPISHSAMDLSQATPVKSAAQTESITSTQNNTSNIPAQSMTNTPLISTSKTRRRKGRAFKLDAASNSEDEAPTPPHTKLTLCDFEENRIVKTTECSATSGDQDKKAGTAAPERTPATVVPASEEPHKTSPKDTYECKYCGIYFRDAVLHTIHMGYHSCDDEFKCNMCGEKCGDRLQFFVHIARFPHS